MVNWIPMAYHFVSSVVNCSVEHSAQIITTATDFAKCVTSKFFV